MYMKFPKYSRRRMLAGAAAKTATSILYSVGMGRQHFVCDARSHTRLYCSVALPVGGMRFTSRFVLTGFSTQV